ncbi:MAG: iron donor protein CyaY [SAR324 cluster bacterium]|nr:iron donor protein CyaY [SAR324 cluster bacterium]
MEMAEYLKRAKHLFESVENKLDEYEDDMDYDQVDGKIEIIFENGSSRLVVNTQRAISEIWLAGGARAWHFKWIDEKQQWLAEAEQEEFYQLLARLIEDRIKKKIVFD